MAQSQLAQEIQAMQNQVVSLDDVIGKFMPLDLYRKIHRTAAHSAVVERARQASSQSNSLILTDAELRTLTESIQKMARTLMEV